MGPLLQGRPKRCKFAAELDLFTGSFIETVFKPNVFDLIRRLRDHNLTKKPLRKQLTLGSS